jgi:hypothetical protein
MQLAHAAAFLCGLNRGRHGKRNDECSGTYVRYKLKFALQETKERGCQTALF